MGGFACPDHVVRAFEAREGFRENRPPAPSLSDLKRLMRFIDALFYPEFFGLREWAGVPFEERVTLTLSEISELVAGQIRSGMQFFGENAGQGETGGNWDTSKVMEITERFLAGLPRIRALLDGDVLAAYEGDPAARSEEEAIFCYPSVRAMMNQRVAHLLYDLSVPVIPRVITEMAHSRTGIDIHPGASIGEEFFIDHGTGVVIGETSVIGRRCRLYQGVTLGALSFPKNADGTLVKGIPRHPILEDGVIVYAGATILGRVTIGAGSTIGSNVWITEDVPPNSKVS
ncbi:MAG: hypothetical protein LBR38_08655 [Synergistaceae bacterium]|jgi:serine O-acetyltransferase|nr:hypothetical protein [Synergistaceae bacterium]